MSSPSVRREIDLQLKSLTGLHSRCVARECILRLATTRAPPRHSASFAAQSVYFPLLPCSVVDSCWAKCIPRPKDGELTIGEMACVDRCVAKYVETGEAVRAELEASRKAAVDYP